MRCGLGASRTIVRSPSAGEGWGRAVGRRDPGLVSIPLCLSFIKWKKGECERGGGRKGDLPQVFVDRSILGKSMSGSQVPEINHLKVIYSLFPFGKFRVAVSSGNSGLDNWSITHCSVGHSACC